MQAWGGCTRSDHALCDKHGKSPFNFSGKFLTRNEQMKREQWGRGEYDLREGKDGRGGGDSRKRWRRRQ